MKLVVPSGCALCGVPQRYHFQQWRSGVGWHGYAYPSAQQLAARIRAWLHATDEERDELRRREVAPIWPLKLGRPRVDPGDDETTR